MSDTVQNEQLKDNVSNDFSKCQGQNENLKLHILIQRETLYYDFNF